VRTRLAALAGLVLATLPALAVWPLGPTGAGAVSLLPVVILHHVATRGSGAPIGPITAFAVGLVLDATTGGPFGYWALVYTVAAAVADVLGRVRTGLVGSLGTLAVVLAVVVAVQAVLTAAHALALVDVRPLALSAALALIAGAPLSGALHLWTRPTDPETPR
jgi:cell shape-determining protein MreD